MAEPLLSMNYFTESSPRLYVGNCYFCSHFLDPDTEPGNLLRVPHSKYREGPDLNPTQPEAQYYQIQGYAASTPERVLVRTVAALCIKELHWLKK